MSFLALPQALKAQLIADAEVNALIEGRFRRKRAQPEDKRPFVTYLRPSGGTQHHGTCGGPDGLAQSRIELICWAKDADTADVLADAVRRCLQEKIGMMGNGQHVIEVRSLTLLPTGETETERGEGSGDFYDGVILPFEIAYIEEIGA